MAKKKKQGCVISCFEIEPHTEGKETQIASKDLDKVGLVNCPTCAGHGEVPYYSKNSEKRKYRKCKDCKGTGDAPERKEAEPHIRVSREKVTLHISFDARTKVQSQSELLHAGKLGRVVVEYREDEGTSHISSNELGFWSHPARTLSELEKLFKPKEALRIFNLANRIGRKFVAQLKERELFLISEEDNH